MESRRRNSTSLSALDLASSERRHTVDHAPIITPPTRGRSHSTTALSPPVQTKEFQQVVSPDVPFNRARRNSMPSPGSDSYKLGQFTHVPNPQGQYLHHITHPDNLTGIKKAGGLMPIALQPKRGRGLDQMTARGAPSVSETVRALVDFPMKMLETNFENLTLSKPLISQSDQNMLMGMKRSEAQLALREGANTDNLYMSRGTGSTKDYMTSYFQSGAVLLRTRAGQNNRGFVPDQQGKAQDMRGRGVVIPNSQLEFAHVSGQHMQQKYDKDEWHFQDLNWQPMNPPPQMQVQARPTRPRSQSLPLPPKKPF